MAKLPIQSRYNELCLLSRRMSFILEGVIPRVIDHFLVGKAPQDAWNQQSSNLEGLPSPVPEGNLIPGSSTVNRSCDNWLFEISNRAFDESFIQRFLQVLSMKERVALHMIRVDETDLPSVRHRLTCCCALSQLSVGASYGYCIKRANSFCQARCFLIGACSSEACRV